MSDWTQGVFVNSMAWSCYGNGDKVALLIPGGPGNPAPEVGWKGKMGIKPFLPLIEEGYRIVTVARARGMPKGYSVEQMASDYAAMIESEFDGQVDLLLGSSYGGMIAQYIAANHPDCFEHIVVMVAACEIVDPNGIDQQFARALAEGRNFAGGVIIAKALYPNSRLPFITHNIFGLLSLAFSGKQHEHYANDIVVEAEAEIGCDTREALLRICRPVLLIGGDADPYFPEALIRETSSLISDCTLHIYRGKDHLAAAIDKRIVQDVLAFVGRE